MAKAALALGKPAVEEGRFRPANKTHSLLPAAHRCTSGSLGFHRERTHRIPSVRLTPLDRKANRGLTCSGIQNSDANVVVAFRQILWDVQSAVEDGIARKPFANIHGNLDHHRRLR